MTPAQTIKLSAAKTYLAGFDPVAQDKLGVLLTLIEELDLEVAQAKQGAQNTADLLISARRELDTMNQTNLALGKKVEMMEQASRFCGDGGVPRAYELLRTCGVPLIEDMLTRPIGHSINSCLAELVNQHKKLNEVYADARRQITDLLAAKGFAATVYRLLDPKELTQAGDEHGYFEGGYPWGWSWRSANAGIEAGRYEVVRRKVADESAALRSEVSSLKAAIVEAQNLYGEDCASYTGTIKELREKVAAHEGATYYTPGEKGALGQVAQIETLLKTYGWPSRAEGRTMIEYLSALLTTFTHQGGVIEGLKHRREESPMMALARAASTKTEEPVARLQERLDAFSGALRDGQMSLDNLITRMTPKGPTLHDVTNIALAHAIIAEALGPKGLVVDEVDFGVFDKSRAHQPITIVAHTA